MATCGDSVSCHVCYIFYRPAGVDVWQSVADLCNVLKNVDINYVKLYRQKKEG